MTDDQTPSEVHPSTVSIGMSALAILPLLFYWCLSLRSFYVAHGGADSWVLLLGPDVGFPFAWLHAGVVVLALAFFGVRCLNAKVPGDRFAIVSLILCAAFVLAHANMVSGADTRSLYQSLMSQLGKPMFIGLYSVGLGASSMFLYERLASMLNGRFAGSKLVAVLFAATMYVLSINSLAYFARGATFFLSADVTVEPNT